MSNNLGNVKNEAGLLFSSDNFKLVKKVLKAGEKVLPHDHIEENVIFTILKGKVNVHLEFDNKKEDFSLTPGEILNFDGISKISADALEDSEFTVTLIKK